MYNTINAQTKKTKQTSDINMRINKCVQLRMQISAVYIYEVL